MKKVAIFTRVTPDYRVPFYLKLNEELSHAGICLVVCSGQLRGGESLKNSISELPFGVELRHIYFSKLCWAKGLYKQLHDADLLVFEQANSLLQIYFYIIARLWNRSRRITFWGHGAYLNSTRPQPVRDAWKKFWLRQVDGWFAYTGHTQKLLIDAGFPVSRITVVQNTIDTTRLREVRAQIAERQLTILRQELFGDSTSAPIGVFCGRLVAFKWIPFLLDSVKAIQKRTPDFRMILVGDGPEREVVNDFCLNNPWCVCVGAKYGDDRVSYLSLGDIWFNPGASGLSILDSFALGIPFLTTDNGIHGPEIDYLKPGINGDMSIPDVRAFTDMAVSMLIDKSQLKKMKDAAQSAGEEYSIENMVNFFSKGVLTVLAEIKE